MGLLRKVVACWKPMIPVALGICLGMSFSMLTVSSWEGSCSEESGQNYSKNEEFEARILEKLPLSANGNQQKVVRRRYAYQELRIRTRLYIGVVISGEVSLDNAIAINAVLENIVPKLVFFSDQYTVPLPQDVQVVKLGTEGNHLAQSMEHVFRHDIDFYDNFLFVSDKTYIHGRKLMDIVVETSVSAEIHTGFPSDSQEVCNPKGGVLLSRNLLAKIGSGKALKCLVTKQQDNWTSLGACLQTESRSTSSVPPCNAEGSLNLPTYTTSDQNSVLEGLTSGVTLDTDQPVLVYPLETAQAILEVHKYSCKKRELEIKQKLAKLRCEISRTVPLAEDSKTKYPWPEDVKPSIKPGNRYEVNPWRYTSKGLVYYPDESTQVRDIHESEKADLGELDRQIRAKYHFSSEYNSAELVSISHRFDPERGMEYQAIYNVSLKKEGQPQYKRNVYKGVRPLGESKLIGTVQPLRVLTGRPVILLPIQEREQDGLSHFLSNYGNVCLSKSNQPTDRGDSKCSLMVLFVHNPRRNGKFDHSTKSKFANAKILLERFEHMYHDKIYNLRDHLHWFGVHPQTGSQVELVDLVARKITPDSLVFFTSVSSVLSTKLLQMIGTNTVEGKQVFSPIGFWEYKLHAARQAAKDTSKGQGSMFTPILMTQRSGLFDDKIHLHVSFYLKDYLNSRLSSAKTSSAKAPLLIKDVFIKHGPVSIFRALEPSLIIRYRSIPCSLFTTSDQYTYHNSKDERSCETELEHHLGSKSELAQLYMSHARQSSST